MIEPHRHAGNLLSEERKLTQASLSLVERKTYLSPRILFLGNLSTAKNELQSKALKEPRQNTEFGIRSDRSLLREFLVVLKTFSSSQEQKYCILGPHLGQV